MGKTIPYRARPASAKTISHLNKVRKQLAPGEATFNAVFLQYRWLAKRRGYDWKLTREDFRTITKKECTYCGLPPSNERASQDNTGSYVYSGIDRINNGIGYTIENTAPCCKICNVAKNTQSLSEFKVWIATVNKRINNGTT